MDDSTRRQFRRDLKDGHGVEGAARRSGISTNQAYSEADRARGDDFSKMMQETWLKPSGGGSAGTSGDLPFGLIALVILGIVIWTNLGTIVQWVLIAGLCFLMISSLATAARGMWTLVLPLWLTLAGGLVGAFVLVVRSIVPNPDPTGFLDARLPQLATGNAWADALVVGVCSGVLALALPWVRDGLFRWISGIGLTQAFRILLAAGLSTWTLRVLPQLFLLPLASALGWALAFWAEPSWVLRGFFCYGLILVASAEFWLWRRTKAAEYVASYFEYVDPHRAGRAWERYGPK